MLLHFSKFSHTPIKFFHTPIGFLSAVIHFWDVWFKLISVEMRLKWKDVLTYVDIYGMYIKGYKFKHWKNRLFLIQNLTHTQKLIFKKNTS